MRIERSRVRHPNRRGGVMPLVLGLVVLILLAGVGFFMFSGDSASGAATSSADLYQVNRGDLEITIPASGDLAALRQVEIRNPLETRAVITYIVDEGEYVEKGDLLVSFATEDIETEITEEKLDVMSARNNLAAARNDLEITQSQNASNLSQAKTDLELAKIEFQQWSEGDVSSQRQSLELAIETAEKDYQRLEEKFIESKKLVDQGFISRDEYKRDEISLIQARATLEMAKLDLKVYEQYQYEREKMEKQSKVDRAAEELERIKAQNRAQFERAEAAVVAAEGELATREDRLEYWMAQKEKAIIRAPQPGLVVYGSSLDSDGWRDNESPPEAGTEVRRNDRILVLPDVSQMVANLKVHESLSGLVEKGQRVRVVSDALPDTTLTGTVQSVGVLAQGGSWRDPNRREYTVKVLLDQTDGLGLKPSMRAKGEILVDNLNNALHVPIQAVYHQNGRSFVYVPVEGGYAQKEVAIGKASSTDVEITKGLEPGDTVLLRNPPEVDIVKRLDFVTSDTGGNMAAATPADNGKDENANNRQASRGSAGGGGMNPASMISQFDQNADGSLQRDEVPAQMESFFDRIDTNGDGAVSADELANMRRPGGGQPSSS